MAKIFGLDISSRSTGWAFLVDGVLAAPADCGKITMKQQTHGERLVAFEAELKRLLSLYQPDIIAIEDYWVSRKTPATSCILAFYHGVARKVVWENVKTEPVIHTATEFRKILGDRFGKNLLPGKKEKLETGKDSKQLTFELITEIFKPAGWKFSSHNDVADALAVCLGTQMLLDTIADTAIKIVALPAKKRIKRGRKDAVS